MKSIQETKGKFRPQLTLWKQYWGPIQENPQKQSPQKCKYVNWKRNRKTPVVSPKKIPPTSHQQLSTVLWDLCDWIHKAPKPGIISLFILGVFPYNKSAKNDRKERRKKKSIYLTISFILAVSSGWEHWGKNYPSQKHGKWFSFPIIWTKKIIMLLNGFVVSFSQTK